jgi:hypothetical protein
LLFGYPIAATHDNWLHECLCEAIRSIHDAANAGSCYPGWPAILPVTQRGRLSARTGLRDRLANYDKAVRRLSIVNRARVLQAVTDQNRISDLLAGTCSCVTIDGLPRTIRRSVESLFGYAYTQLTDLGLRDRHYRVIYDSVRDHVCPFCGTEYFDAPGAPREDLDHYLAKSLYPFAAANLRNLVPMGHKCNSKYKLAADILCCADGTRRVVFDPYDHADVVVLLDDSDPFSGATGNTPKWEVRFEPDSPAVSAWDEIFKVRERFCRDHLDPSFASWIRIFGEWACSIGLNLATDDAIVDALARYESFWRESGMQDRAFLKAAVFRMLHRHCEAGHRRLLDLIKDLTRLSRPSVSLVGSSTLL